MWRDWRSLRRSLDEEQAPAKKSLLFPLIFSTPTTMRSSFTPTPTHRIGELNKLDRVTDWGFCALDTDVSFSNKSYFVAPVPTHFVTSTDVKDHCTQYSYFAADGYSTGIVWMTLTGVHTERNRQVHRLTSIHSYLLQTS
jgi:hypothetical protein